MIDQSDEMVERPLRVKKCREVVWSVRMGRIDLRLRLWSRRQDTIVRDVLCLLYKITEFNELYHHLQYLYNTDHTSRISQNMTVLDTRQTWRAVNLTDLGILPVSTFDLKKSSPVPFWHLIRAPILLSILDAINCNIGHSLRNVQSYLIFAFLFYTAAIWGQEILHLKVRKIATKVVLRQN